LITIVAHPPSRHVLSHIFWSRCNPSMNRNEVINALQIRSTAWGRSWVSQDRRPARVSGQLNPRIDQRTNLNAIHQLANKHTRPAANKHIRPTSGPRRPRNRGEGVPLFGSVMLLSFAAAATACRRVESE
jgi:hypothetical protein